MTVAVRLSALLLAALLVVAVVVSLVTGDITSDVVSSPSPSVGSIVPSASIGPRQRVVVAFEGVALILVESGQARQEWVTGRVDDDAWTRRATRWAASIDAAHQLVNELDAEAAVAARLHCSIDLHASSLRVDVAAASVVESDLREQLQRVGRRVRALADACFDRAQVLLGADSSQLPPIPPDWGHLAAGPGAPLVIDASPGELPDLEPQTSLDDALELLGAPDEDGLAAALAGPPVSALALADQMTGVVRSLGSLAPNSDADDARLYLAVGIEALRTAAAGMLAVSSTLADLADQILVTARRLAPPSLSSAVG